MRGTDRQAAAPLTAFEGLANALYCAVVQPDTIWWDDLTPEMQEGWRRAAKVAARSDSLDATWAGWIEAAICRSEIAGSGHATGDIPCEWHTVAGNVKVARFLAALREGRTP